MTEDRLRDQIVAYGCSLFDRGYSCGSSGNLSVRLEDGGYLMTPTNVALGRLDRHTLSRLDASGQHVDGSPPTKEAWLHLAMYGSRPDDQAIVHLHSTYAAALSCRSDVNRDDMLPPITPYVIMRVGRVPLVPYGRPGDRSLGAEIARRSQTHHALLLANHGPVVAAASLDGAVAAAEELEETAKLFFLLEGRPHRLLTDAQVEDVRRVFGS
jgi:ribulose-5-phosphate 4-epimerase/fuculose-1-phosphate aldolase